MDFIFEREAMTEEHDEEELEEQERQRAPCHARVGVAQVVSRALMARS